VIQDNKIENCGTGITVADVTGTASVSNNQITLTNADNAKSLDLSSSQFNISNNFISRVAMGMHLRSGRGIITGNLLNIKPTLTTLGATFCGGEDGSYGICLDGVVGSGLISITSNTSEEISDDGGHGVPIASATFLEEGSVELTGNNFHIGGFDMGGNHVLATLGESEPGPIRTTFVNDVTFKHGSRIIDHVETTGRLRVKDNAIFEGNSSIEGNGNIDRTINVGSTGGNVPFDCAWRSNNITGTATQLINANVTCDTASSERTFLMSGGGDCPVGMRLRRSTHTTGLVSLGGFPIVWAAQDGWAISCESDTEETGTARIQALCCRR
jgi:hypothetical protein